MFCRGHKARARDLEQQLAQERLRARRQDEELDAASATIAALEAKVGGLQGEIDKCSGIYRNMQSFGASFLEIQRSQLSIANTMKEEKKNAVEASQVSQSSQGAIETISGNIGSMSVGQSEIDTGGVRQNNALTVEVSNLVTWRV